MGERSDFFLGGGGGGVFFFFSYSLTKIFFLGGGGYFCVSDHRFTQIVNSTPLAMHKLLTMSEFSVSILYGLGLTKTFFFFPNLKLSALHLQKKNFTEYEYGTNFRPCH